MNPRSTDISREDWGKFFERISGRLSARPVCVLFSHTSRRVHTVAPRAPFVCCTLESNSAGTPCVEVTTREPKGRRTVYTLVGPRRVWTSQESEGSDECVGIEAGDGCTLVLQFVGSTSQILANEPRERRSMASATGIA